LKSDKTSTDSLQKAKNYAFLLLKFRQRSEKEIYLRLKKKKFSQEIISQVLSFLRDKGFIDDQLFAKAWISSRLKKPLGLRRVREELKIKGIEKGIIEGEISAVKKDYSEADAVISVAKKRLSILKGIEPDKAKRRVYAYLIRRGFSPEIAIDAINNLCRQIL
jgi:regulatory protein